MKNSLKLKALASFTFLIFFLPFLRTCSDQSIKSFPRLEATELVDKSIDVDYEEQKLNQKKEEILEESKKDFTFNFYELLFTTLEEKKLQEYDSSTFKDISFYPLFCYLLIFVNSIIILIITFIEKYRLTYKLGIFNLVLLICSVVALILSEVVEDINQFKIGYYLLILNSIILILTARKAFHAEYSTQKNIL
ncbi:hypothetical protein ASG31_08205 [Chryseobacterium sp. Leaf404]|uniref:hypothetical protein n=1 Tax=unclassified Chryseobacterium TaxID=2593645 RepID=UPI0006F4D95F|nr:MULTISPECIES: hypothetical protein [unclassified Chryseobacterium]KQT17384.1 hypothetical protein ASG31_08205 [Chryseobacterium sp. Leaf404]